MPINHHHGPPINLNKARKAKAKTARQAKAAENRVKFGRTKVEKAADQREIQRAKREIDGKRRDS